MRLVNAKVKTTHLLYKFSAYIIVIYHSVGAIDKKNEKKINPFSSTRRTVRQVNKVKVKGSSLNNFDFFFSWFYEKVQSVVLKKIKINK